MSEKDFSAEENQRTSDSAARPQRESDAGPEPAGGSGMKREGDALLSAGEVAGGRGLAFDQARLAYSIINGLLEHTRVTSDLIALMAQVIDEETTKALTLTPYWTAYLDSRRAMERTRQEIERFAEVWTQLAGEEGPPEV